MITIRTITRTATIIASAALVAGAAAPASAASDPVTTPKAEEAKPAAKPVKLNRIALNAVWCVNTPAKDGEEAKKECKSRKNWIKEGRDPFAK
jgi:hypothetical protein